jgi:hypothetical protein
MRRLPDRRAAPIDAVNIRIGDQRGGQALAYLSSQKPIGQGELYVTVRNAFGRRQRGGPVRYQDYDVGRVVVVVSGGYLSVAPATKLLLRDRLLAARPD